MIDFKYPFVFVLILIQQFSIYGQEQVVRINEIVSSNNSTLTDQDGDYSDWIELYNSGNTPVNLRLWTLTDDISDSADKWKFPDILIAGKSYLIVFASGKNKNSNEMHTNFKLSKNGEYLALRDIDGNIISEFKPKYPEMEIDHSFSFIDGDYIISSSPTPAEENSYGIDPELPKPQYSHSMGFHDSPFELKLSTGFDDAIIYYTIDSSDPTLANSKIYTNPISIRKTTTVRSFISKSGLLSPTTTYTYILINDIITQSNQPEGYPPFWGNYTNNNGNAIADYEMDPEITNNPEYAEKITNSLMDLPTISIVTNKENLFSTALDPNTGGIYIYSGAEGQPGAGWERPASFELFDKDGTRKLQINCGLEIHGGESRRIEKSPKHSFRISFKNEYGPSKLTYPLFGEEATGSFNSVILRAGFNNSFIHWNSADRARGQYVRDLWMKETHRLMGHPAGRGFLAHLYLNGIYWGIYNPTERINEDFMQSYFGGNSEDYDIMKDYSEVASGNGNAWTEIMNMVNAGLTSQSQYNKLIGKNEDGTNNPDYPTYVDPVSLADYMILNMYAGNTDWDHHNWVAARNRNNANQGFQFYCWDSEFIFENQNRDVTDEYNTNCPSAIFQAMMSNDDFRDLFQQRVRIHCTNDGLLTPQSAGKRFEDLTQVVELAVIAETARWGDYRRDVHPYSSGPYELYTLESFENHRNYLLNQYFPERTATLLNQLKQRGHLPEIAAPDIQINEQLVTSESVTVKSDDLLTISGSATSYYTVNGTDPKNEGVNATDVFKYDSPITTSKSSKIWVRSFDGTNWSASSKITYYIDMVRDDLKLTEINYNPLDQGDIDGKDLEFIELKNTGSQLIDLGGLKIEDGIRLTFPIGTQIDAGKFLVIGADKSAFFERYGFNPDFQFDGNLGNTGDQFRLVSNNNSILWDITYTDKAPWPTLVSGSGYTLVPISYNPPGHPSDASQWRHSNSINGSPGADDAEITELSTNTHDDSGILIYPNPTYGKITVEYELAESDVIECSISDITGKKIKSARFHNAQEGNKTQEFDLTGFSNGIYFMIMTTTKNQIKQKFVLQNP